MNPRAAALALSLLPMVACDVAFIPDLADQAVRETATVEVTLGASNVESVDPAIEKLEVEIVDVLLHRSSDDVWIIVNANEVEIDLVDMAPTLGFTGIPISQGQYDGVMLIFDQARVMRNGEWHEVTMTEPDVQLTELVDVTATGATFDLEFDLHRALDGGPIGGWTLDPNVTITVPEDVPEPPLPGAEPLP